MEPLGVGNPAAGRGAPRRVVGRMGKLSRDGRPVGPLRQVGILRENTPPSLAGSYPVDQPSRGGIDTDMATQTHGQPNPAMESERFGPTIRLKPADAPVLDSPGESPPPQRGTPEQPSLAATGPDRWATSMNPAALPWSLLAAKGMVQRHELEIARLEAQLAVARSGAVQVADIELDRLLSDLEAARLALAEARVDETVLTRLVAATNTPPPPRMPNGSSLADRAVPPEAPPALMDRLSHGLRHGLLVVVLLALVLLGASMLLLKRARPSRTR